VKLSLDDHKLFVEVWIVPNHFPKR